MNRTPQTRPATPTRARRQTRPTLDRLEDRLQPNNLGGLWDDAVLTHRPVARPRAAEITPALARQVQAGQGRRVAPSPLRQSQPVPVIVSRPATPPRPPLGAPVSAAVRSPGTPSVPSVARVPVATPPVSRPSAPAPAATPTPLARNAAATTTATATSTAPTVTVSSSFASDGGYTLSQWGPYGSKADGIALWTVPGTTTQEIVTVGTTNTSSSNGIGVARYRTDGTFDAGYGTGGVATNTLGVYGSSGHALALKPDGTVVGAGTVSFGAKGAITSINFLAERLTTSGALHTTFNGTGWANTNLSNSWNTAYAVGVQSTGKIVEAGKTQSTTYSNTNSAILRFTAAGALDAGAGGFGQTGSNGAPLGYRVQPMGQYANSDLDALAVQPDDKIVTVGRAYGTSTSDMQLTLTRFTADGNPDPTFNNGAPVLFAQDTASVAWGRAVALQPDGKILVAGDAGATTSGPPRVFLAARFNPDGTLDTTFNNGAGSIRVAIPSETNARAVGMAIDGAGRIVLGGDWTGTVNGSTVYGVATVRLNPDGTPDATFGTSGIKSKTFPNTSAVRMSGLAIANDGSYYLSGTTGNTSTLLVHFLP